MLQQRGYEVTGSDEHVYPPMSTFLEEKGIGITQGFRAEDIPAVDLVVIGNAMTRGNPAVEAILNRKVYYLSLPEILKEFFLRGRHNLVVTGTHGKTTATSLLAWIFESAGLAPSYLIGGIPENLGQGARLRDSKYFIIEGDEYDTAFFDKGPKFLHYRPRHVILTSVEFDHADIYRDLDHVKSAFRRLVDIIPSDGSLVVCGDYPVAMEIAAAAPCERIAYGDGGNVDWTAKNLQFHEGRIFFEPCYRGKSEGRVELAGIGHDDVLGWRAVGARRVPLGTRGGDPPLPLARLGIRHPHRAVLLRPQTLPCAGVSSECGVGIGGGEGAVCCGDDRGLGRERLRGGGFVVSSVRNLWGWAKARQRRAHHPFTERISWMVATLSLLPTLRFVTGRRLLRRHRPRHAAPGFRADRDFSCSSAKCRDRVRSDCT